MPETATNDGGAVFKTTGPSVEEATNESEFEPYTDEGGSLDLDVDEVELDEACERMEAAFEAEENPGERLEGAYDGEDESEGLIRRAHRMGQMGARRIGSLAIGIGVVGIVLNQMSELDVVTNSTGVIDVSSIFQTAGSGLNLLVVGVIIAAAAVLLNLWSGF